MAERKTNTGLKQLLDKLCFDIMHDIKAIKSITQDFIF